MSWMFLSKEAYAKSEILIRNVLKTSTDFHNIFTPFPLCQQIIDKIDQQQLEEGKWLIIANLEFVVMVGCYFRYRGWDVNNIYYVTPCDLKSKIAVDVFRISKDNVGKYNYETLDVCGDFGDMKFDVVVGNPPYQPGELPSEKNTISSPLWYDFVDLLPTLLAEGGYGSFITPTTWLQKNNRPWQILANYQFIGGKILGKVFGSDVNTTASYWVLRKRPTTNTMMLTVGQCVVDITTINRIPTSINNFEQTLSIFNKTFNSISPRMPVVISDLHYSNQRKDIVSSIKDDNHQYPVFNTHASPLMWSRFKDNYHNSWKVILPYTGTVSRAVIEYEKSATERGIMFPVMNENQCYHILSFLKSKLIRFLFINSRTNATLPRDVFRSLPEVDISCSWTNQELYDHFNLTQEEVDLIESTVK